MNTRWLCIVYALGVLSACTPSPPPSKLPPSMSSVSSAAPEPPASSSPPAMRSTELVNAAVLVAKCPDTQRMDARLAELALRQLVEPCRKVPGGAAHFMATLLPAGRIELSSPAGDPQEGVVPTCVLTHPLVHHVRLQKPCTLDVRLDERALVVP